MKRLYVIIVALVAMWGLTHMAFTAGKADAAGFALFEWGNRANGMAGATVATPNPDPSTVASNPAIMTKLEGTHTLVGATWIAPKATLGTPGQESVETKGKVYTVPHAYATIQLTDDLWFGIGEFSRFGLGTNYDHDWFGAENVYKASIETFSLNPTMAYKVNDAWSVAAGLELIYGKMDLRQHVIRAGGAVNEDIHMAPEGMAWSYNLGAYWEPNEVVSFGLHWRKGFVFKGRGDLDAYNLNGDINEDLSPTEQMTMWAQFPGSLSGGIALRATEDWTIEFDAIYTTWSQFETMEYDFDEESVNKVNVILSPNSTSHKQYSNSLRLAVGTEYEACDGVFLRAGYVYDPSPQNPEYMDYMLPANNRQIVSTGLGFAWDDFSLDASFMYLWSQDYVIDNNVGGVQAPTNVTGGKTLIGGLGLSYKF